MSEDAAIHTALVRDAHAYTRSATPWRLEKYGKRLFHYLSGGGLRAFGRSVRQEEADAKRTRFLAVAALLAVLWLALLVGG